MPVDPHRADQFQDTAGQSNSEILAKSQMQISLAVGTGVLVIVITTLVALVFSQNAPPFAGEPPVRGNGPTSLVVPGTLPASASPQATGQPSGDPVPPGQPNPTATTKPPATTPPATQGPAAIEIAALTCLSDDLPVGDFTTCTVTLTSAPLSQLVVELHRPSPEITAPDTLTFLPGVTQMSFQPLAQPLPDGEASITVRLTARVNGTSDHVDITVRSGAT